MESYTIDSAVIVDNEVYVFGDGRACSGEIGSEGLIMTGAALKFRAVTEDAVVAYAGSSSVIQPMHTKIYNTGRQFTLNTTQIRDICNNYMESWKIQPTNLGKPFPASALVCGFSSTKTAIIYQVGEDPGETTEEDVIEAIGSGKNLFFDYLEAVDPSSLDGMLDATVCTCMRDINCGGFITLAKISLLSTPKIYVKRLGHCFHYFASNYSRLSWIFANNEFLCVSNHHSYSLVMESEVKTGIESVLGSQVRIQIVAIHSVNNLIVRIVQCLDPEAVTKLRRLNVPNLIFEEVNEVSFINYASNFINPSENISNASHPLLHNIDDELEGLRFMA